MASNNRMFKIVVSNDHAITVSLKHIVSINRKDDAVWIILDVARTDGYEIDICFSDDKNSKQRAKEVYDALVEAWDRNLHGL